MTLNKILGGTEIGDEDSVLELLPERWEEGTDLETVTWGTDRGTQKGSKAKEQTNFSSALFLSLLSYRIRENQGR
jgi:hypothetical protein